MIRTILTLGVITVSVWCLLAMSGCATISNRATTSLIIEAYNQGKIDGRQEVVDLFQKMMSENAQEEELEGVNDNPKIKL